MSAVPQISKFVVAFDSSDSFSFAFVVDACFRICSGSDKLHLPIVSVKCDQRKEDKKEARSCWQRFYRAIVVETVGTSSIYYHMMLA